MRPLYCTTYINFISLLEFYCEVVRFTEKPIKTPFFVNTKTSQTPKPHSVRFWRVDEKAGAGNGKSGRKTAAVL